MKPIIIFLHDPSTKPHANNNHILLPNAFEELNWETRIYNPEDISLKNNSIEFGSDPLPTKSLIWTLGFGRKATTLDRFNILHNAPNYSFVTSVSELLLTHGKASWAEFFPETIISQDVSRISEGVSSSEHQWVLKPLAGSFGRSVHKVNEKDIKLVHSLLREFPDQYWVLQRYIEGIERGETRTIIAGREIIGSYLRKPKDAFRANLAQGGQIDKIELSERDRLVVEQIIPRLADRNIGFAAVDTCEGFLVEVNIVNPGGLSSLEAVYSEDFSKKTALAIINAKVN